MSNTFYTGVVENRNDPLKLGRVQVRVFDVHSENKADVPTAALPWATVLSPASSAAISGIGSAPIGLVEGSTVVVFFLDGDDKQIPVVAGTTHGIPQTKAGVDTGGKTETEISQPSPAVKPEPAFVNSACCSELDLTNFYAAFPSQKANIDLVKEKICSAGITNPFTKVAILSNVGKECGFKVLTESTRYTTVERIRAVFGKRVASLTDDQLTQGYVNNPEALANLVYAGRIGNGDQASGDGYRYRGRGFIQLTGKDNYKAVGAKIGIDIVTNPDLLLTPENAAASCIQYFLRASSLGKLNSYTSLSEACTEVTRLVNPGGLAMDLPKVTGYASKIVISAEKKNSDEPDVTPAGEKDENGNISLGIPPVASVGFTDPNGKYPLNSRLKEPDTPRLARRIVRDTAVQKRWAKRRPSIRSIDREWSEPKSAYNARYPFNKAFESESGHVIELDDTPDGERINVYHKSGSYFEIDVHGNFTKKTMGDEYLIVERNGYMYVDGTLRLTVGSTANIVIMGNANLSVDGDMNIDAGGSFNVRAADGINFSTRGSFNANASGNVNMDGSEFHWKEGAAPNLGSSSRDPRIMDYPEFAPVNFVDEVFQEYDDSDAEVVDMQHKDLISMGNLTQDDLDSGYKMTPTEKDPTPPPVKAPPAVEVKKEVFENMETFPLSMQLSTNYKLSDLVGKNYPVRPQGGLTEGQIVGNLKALAVNVLEKIKAQYPNMRVNSTYRPYQGNPSSQHPLGMAADMQFPGVAKSDYYGIAQWIRDNVLYDQLLLEYKTGGTGLPWIHVSYNESPRRMVLTFMNDKKHSNGLANLG